jgi:hypothetical protein
MTADWYFLTVPERGAFRTRWEFAVFKALLGALCLAA